MAGEIYLFCTASDEDMSSASAGWQSCRGSGSRKLEKGVGMGKWRFSFFASFSRTLCVSLTRQHASLVGPVAAHFPVGVASRPDVKVPGQELDGRLHSG
jgi:hypothetical protein